MATAVQPMSTTLQSSTLLSSSSSTFTCSISVANTKYSIGEEVLPWLMFVLTNNDPSNAYYILKWHTPLEGFRNNFLKVYRNGEELPYEGIMVKRGNPDPASYDLVLPGSSVSGSVYLEEAYDLSKPGKYRVELNTSLMDVAKDEGGEFTPRAIGDFKGQDLMCEPITFEIME